MKPSFWFGIFFILAGLAIIILPDSGIRLFSINKEHGPSILDLTGILLITGTWIYLMAGVWKNQRRLVQNLGIFFVRLLLVMIIIGSIMIIAGLSIESDGILWTGVLLASCAYLIMITIVFKKRNK